MQRQMSRPDQELGKTLSTGMAERDRAVSLSEVEAEHQATKRALLDSRTELLNKEKAIESLKMELVRAKEFQLKLAEKDVAMGEMKKDLMRTTTRISVLETELEEKCESEVKLLESLFSQTKQLEQTKISLEESKLEIDFLNSNGESKPKAATLRKDGSKGFDHLKYEIELLKQNLVRAEESERLASSRAESLAHEMSVLKNELKLATEAEEKSSRAMDDLASVLKEVTSELNNVKEELSEAESEMEQLRAGVTSKEDKLKALLEEARREANQCKNTAERLRHEAEETLIACTEKEAGFISYIKKVEEERASAQKENKRLLESLLEAEKMTRTSKDETHKLRDILKQALNEANAAKEAAGIAKRENSQLKDCLVEKDRALDFLTHEYENLKQREVAAQESIKELKKMLQRTSVSKDSPRPNEDDHKDQQNDSTTTSDHDREHDHEPAIPKPPKVGKAMSFDLTELRIPKPIQTDPLAGLDPVKAEALRGSIFDTESPPAVPTHHRKKSSSVYTDDSETMVTDEESDHLEGGQFDEHGNRIKKRALLRRFGDLLIRKRVGLHTHHHRREPSSIE
ncbi:hypothetical protein QQ045_025240 [Rhodiola kirilowii]